MLLLVRNLNYFLLHSELLHYLPVLSRQLIAMIIDCVLLEGAHEMPI